MEEELIPKRSQLTYPLDNDSKGALKLTLDDIIKDVIINNNRVLLDLPATTNSFPIASNYMVLSAPSAITIGTITGGKEGMELTLEFVDSNITITDTGSGAANTINLSANFTSSANDVLQLRFNGTSWREVGKRIAAKNNLIIVGTGDTTYTNSTFNETTWISISIPANTLGSGNAVRLRGNFLHTPGGDTGTKQFKFKYGSTTIVDTGALTPTNNVYSGFIELVLMGAGSTGSQAGYLQIMAGGTNFAAYVDLTRFINYTDHGTSSEDSTGTLNMVITITSGSDNGSATIKVTDYIVEKIS